jgi:hypothetical protein
MKVAPSLPMRSMLCVLRHGGPRQSSGIPHHRTRGRQAEHGSNQTSFAPARVRRGNNWRACASISRGDLPQHNLADASRQYDELGGGHAWYRPLNSLLPVVWQRVGIAGNRTSPAIRLGTPWLALDPVIGQRRQPSSGCRDQGRRVPFHGPSQTACSRQRAVPHRRCYSN